MKHEEIKGLIVAFMDGEIREDIKDEIVQHIASCPSCSDEYQALMGMDSYMKNSGEISPPAYFRENLERKLKAGKERRFELNILKLIPATAALAAFVLFASVFMVASPYIYAGDSREVPVPLAESIKSAVVTCMTGSVFSPAAFAAFCDNCSVQMCECCRTNDPNHKCVCGGHKHGK